MRRGSPGFIPVTEYKGIVIHVDQKGVFSTNGDDCQYGTLTGESVDEVKKAIDKAGGKKVTKTPGFRFGGRYDNSEKIENVTVSSTVATRYGNAAVWLTLPKGGREKDNAAEVYKDTPSNRDLAKLYVAACKTQSEAGERAERIKERLVSFAADVKQPE